MIDALTALIADQGWLAPMWYVAGFLMTALLPVVPTPLVAAVGGTAFGAGPAIFYGLIGMGLGAALSLTIARRLGRPVLRRIVPEATWAQWEAFLGVRSYFLWFVIFILLNMDIVVMASGLSSLSARALWATAMAARIPWLIGAAWFGDLLLVNDAALVAVLIVMVPVLWLVNKGRPALQRWLTRLAEASQDAELRREEARQEGVAYADGPPAPGPDGAPPAPAEVPTAAAVRRAETEVAAPRLPSADAPSVIETKRKIAAARARKRRR